MTIRSRRKEIFLGISFFVCVWLFLGARLPILAISRLDHGILTELYVIQCGILLPLTVGLAFSCHRSLCFRKLSLKRRQRTKWIIYHRKS